MMPAPKNHLLHLPFSPSNTQAMKKRFISTTTVLDPYGLVRVSGEVARDRDYDPITEGCTGSPFDVSSLAVVDETGEDITISLNRMEIENMETVLIDLYCDEEQAYKDYLIDEMIERGREYARNAYA